MPYDPTQLCECGKVGSANVHSAWHPDRHVYVAANGKACDSRYNIGRGEWLHCSGEHTRGNIMRDDPTVHQQRYAGIRWTWYSDEADRTNPQ